MANERKMDSERTHIYISSSIENWRDKIEKKLKGYNGDKLLFFGMYHDGDLKKLSKASGDKVIFWQGSDIMQLTYERAEKIKPSVEHYCENEVCQSVLENWGIRAEIKPIFWGDPDKYEMSYKQSENPQIWLCAHLEREKEYGVDKVYMWAEMFKSYTFHIYGIDSYFDLENVIFHGVVPEKEMDRDMKNYQCGLRYNEFDGLSEVVSKSMLMGQHVISRIGYPYSKFPIYRAFEELKNKPANIEGRKYYLKEFKKPIYETTTKGK